MENLNFSERSRIRNQEIGFIFQSFNLIGDLTVEENVELPLTYRAGMPSAERKRRVKEALERVNMAHRMRHYPAQLSGGQQQRVAVARALAGSPSILLADEPTGNLDSKNGEAVMRLLADLHREGSTICMVTHDPRFARHAASRGASVRRQGCVGGGAEEARRRSRGVKAKHEGPAGCGKAQSSRALQRGRGFRTAEQCRKMRGFGPSGMFLGTRRRGPRRFRSRRVEMLQDLTYALRQLRSSPGFTLTAIFTLALGIAGTSTIYSWIDSTLLNPIPAVAHTSAMVTIQRGERSEHPSPPFSYDDYVDLRSGTTALSGLLAYHDDFMAITGNGKPERIYGALTSANYFEVLGVKPILGRSLSDTAANERAGAAEVVLGYDLWQHHFDSDPAIVGQKIDINMHSYTVVGVAPRGFEGCKTGLRTELWLPLGMDHYVWGSNRIDHRGGSWLNVVGLLRPGVDRQQAQNELNLLMQRIVERFPDSHLGNNGLSLDPLWRSPFGANVYLSGTLPILLGLAAVLLLLACANVADLLLVRAVSRRREFAIRLSMGATRGQLVWQLMVENVLVALAGGAVALAITLWTSRTLGSFLPTTTLPLDINGHVDARVLLATFFVAALTAVISGAVPALRASALSPVTVLKDEALSTSGGLGKSRLTAGLAAAQIALSLVLLVCAGLFVRSLMNSEKAFPGFNSDNVLLASYDLDPMGYSSSRRWNLTGNCSSE